MNHGEHGEHGEEDRVSVISVTSVVGPRRRVFLEAASRGGSR